MVERTDRHTPVGCFAGSSVKSGTASPVHSMVSARVPVLA